ncbi:MAG: LytR/AlgR family response regulator transcription factor [Aestuariibacter sp.]
MLQQRTDPDPINVIIVDDEQLARQGLAKRLESYPQLQISKICPHAHDALSSIKAQSLDAIFLDIEMPGMTGIELLQTMQKEQIPMPYIIFTTAYQDFALQAFDFEPCDYLLKPIEQQRLQLCIERLSNFLNTQRLAQKTEELDSLLSRRTGNTLAGLIKNLQESSQCQISELQKQVSFKVGTEWIKIPLHDIFWVEAAGDYMCLHLRDEQHIIRKTMKQLEQELSPHMFPRVNRSAMVNIQQVCKLTPNSNGEYHAHLKSGAKVKVSRKYKFKLDELRA